MAQAGFVDAVWVAAYVGELPDGTICTPGETVVSVPKDEAQESDNWKPVTKAQAKRIGAGDSGGSDKDPEGGEA